MITPSFQLQKQYQCEKCHQHISEKEIRKQHQISNDQCLQAIAKGIQNHDRNEKQLQHEIYQFQNQIQNMKKQLELLQCDRKIVEALKGVKESQIQNIQDQKLAKTMYLKEMYPKIQSNIIESIIQHNPDSTIEQIQELIDQ